ncbi:hypothetical protein K504DRAFT_508847 [Pleomassaria siparia CBS 279.74]|uniref:Uncharacterized protein n=1 Tax=Pleomassaria siparia CBS 279.74 TaxID=1314801 RepID=A0A6G1JQR5_9PLEO|nr:hypothetical protein K504DRAFT_508847 [Pleomassaria siparia CBS 279.74]
MFVLSLSPASPVLVVSPLPSLRALAPLLPATILPSSLKIRTLTMALLKSPTLAPARPLPIVQPLPLAACPHSEGSKTVLADVRILVLSYLAYNKGRLINAPALEAAHARLKAVYLKETRSKLEVPSLDSSRSPRSSSSANKADLTVQRDIHARLLAVKRYVKASEACLLNIRAQLLAFNKDFHAAFLGQYIVP